MISLVIFIPFFNLQAEDLAVADTAEAQVFWLALVLTPVIWFLLLFVSFFRLNVKWFVSKFLHFT